jgi:hypothetical protein
MVLQIACAIFWRLLSLVVMWSWRAGLLAFERNELSQVENQRWDNIGMKMVTSSTWMTDAKDWEAASINDKLCSVVHPLEISWWKWSPLLVSSWFGRYPSTGHDGQFLWPYLQCSHHGACMHANMVLHYQSWNTRDSIEQINNLLKVVVLGYANIWSDESVNDINVVTKINGLSIQNNRDYGLSMPVQSKSVTNSEYSSFDRSLCGDLIDF